tara:strand:- start:127 stop:738 length:612 start_codon:yes stop_codon:yes gene_type:complete
MKILIACEYSGIVRDAFTRKGHDAMSCDILPTESEGKHYQGDIFDVLYDDWDMMIAHPPCTHLSVSGARWFTEGKKDWSLQIDALDFVRKLLDAPINKIALENPVSVISTKIRKPDQTINPYQFGHTEQKRTCLWLKNLPKLKETNNVKEEMMKLPIAVRTRIHWLGSGKGKERSKFYTGIAEAMADQWGNEVEEEKQMSLIK